IFFERHGQRVSRSAISSSESLVVPLLGGVATDDEVPVLSWRRRRRYRLLIGHGLRNLLEARHPPYLVNDNLGVEVQKVRKDRFDVFADGFEVWPGQMQPRYIGAVHMDAAVSP